MYALYDLSVIEALWGYIVDDFRKYDTKLKYSLVLILSGGIAKLLMFDFEIHLINEEV